MAEATLYRELKLNEFRLLKIHPGNTSLISCELFPAFLDKPPEYVAISYVWGDPVRKERMVIGDIEASITVSLHGALNALRRRSDVPITVWADAICINQQNHEERSCQVGEMSRIYKQATSVAVWLGPEADGSSRAMSFLEKVADSSDKPHRVRNLIKNPRYRNDVLALVSLFERPYWRRLWVVQEILNAAKVDVYCGEGKLPWHVYRDSSKAFEKQRSILPRECGKNTRLPISDILARRGPRTFPTEVASDLSLLTALHACRPKLATDPRDKVFGVLGILSPDVCATFPPDYGLTVKEVYTNVAVHVLRTTRRFELVCEAIRLPGYESAYELPSWVPDWSQDPQPPPLGLSYRFNASQDTSAILSFRDDYSKLLMSAVYLDTIKNCGISVAPLCSADDFLMAFLDWWNVLAKNLPKDIPEEEMKEACKSFCRTLCVGQIPLISGNTWTWEDICYHLFVAKLRERFSEVPELSKYDNANVNVDTQLREDTLRDTCGKRMAGRRFGVTNNSLIGMGSQFMAPGDIIVIPLGCSTPVILREQRGEYRFVGDIYVDGYMFGRAVDEKRQVSEYVMY